MVSNEKRLEAVTKFLNSYYKMVACGIEFDEKKCNDTKMFFTYPESVSFDCLVVDYSALDDGTYQDLIRCLIRSPKEVCVDLVKRFMVYTAAFGMAENQGTDDFELDWWYEDIEASRKMLPVKLFAKARNGETWTAKDVRKRIADAEKQFDEGINKIKELYAGYSEV